MKIKVRIVPSKKWEEINKGSGPEKELENMISESPDILPIDEISREFSRLIAIVKQAGLRGAGTTDLIGVDQKGNIYIIECKLAKNPEAKRAVIGQVLEYAAFLWGYSFQQFDQLFVDKLGKHLTEIVEGSVDEDDWSEEEFRTQIEENLINGTFNLIIAVDEISDDLRKIIEYLNTVSKSKIFAAEMMYFKNNRIECIIPRIIGQTPRPPLPDSWTADRLRNAYDNLPDRELGKRLREVLDWAIDRRIFLEARRMRPGFGLRGNSGDSLISFSHDGNVYCIFKEDRYPGKMEERQRLVSELKALTMLTSDFNPQDVLDGRYLARKLTDLTEDEFKSLLEVFSHFCGTAK